MKKVLVMLSVCCVNVMMCTERSRLVPENYIQHAAVKDTQANTQKIYTTIDQEQPCCCQQLPALDCGNDGFCAVSADVVCASCGSVGIPCISISTIVFMIVIFGYM